MFLANSVFLTGYSRCKCADYHNDNLSLDHLVSKVYWLKVRWSLYMPLSACICVQRSQKNIYHDFHIYHKVPCCTDIFNIFSILMYHPVPDCVDLLNILEQTWYLSKILHSQIFMQKVLHRKSALFATFFSQMNSVNASNINNLVIFWL